METGISASRRSFLKAAGAIVIAALIGTMLHLGVCVAVMGAVLVLKIRLAPAFTYWLMAFYVTSLTALAAGLVTEVRAVAARAAAGPARPPKGPWRHRR